MAAKFEVYQEKKGTYRFRFKAGNGEIIAVSEPYQTKEGCKNGIEVLKANVVKAKVEEIQ